jgi:uncharacterized membrane protein YtjA (UPF0391 family)
MLSWAFTFLILAIIAGLLGFGGIASASIEIAQVLCFLFLIVFAISLVAHLITGRRPPPVI